MYSITLKEREKTNLLIFLDGVANVAFHPDDAVVGNVAVTHVMIELCGKHGKAA